MQVEPIRPGRRMVTTPMGVIGGGREGPPGTAAGGCQAGSR